MAKTPLLNRRPSGIYHVRLSVPKSLRHAIGQSEIHRSTGCRELHLAKIVAGQLLNDWRRLLQHYSKMDIRKLAAGSLSIVGDGYMRLPDAAAELGRTPRALFDSMIACGRTRIFVQADKWMGWLTSDLHEMVSLDRDEYSGEVLSRDIDFPRLQRQGPQQPFTGRLRVAYLDDVEPLVDGAESVSLVVFTLPATHNGGFISDFPGIRITLDMLTVLREDMSHVASRLMAQVAEAASAKTTVEAAARSTRSDIPISKLVEEFFEANSTAWERQDHKC